MQATSASRTLALDDARAVRWARQPVGLRVLGAFIGRASPLAPVAQRLGLAPSTALRWVRRWVDAGALAVVDERARAGRPVKWYRATAPRLFIPYEAEGSALPEEVVRRLLQLRVEPQARGLVAAAGRTLARSGAAWGTLIYADRHGELVVRPDFEGGRTPQLLREGEPAYLNVYTDGLRLGATQAKRLQRELVALLQRYKDSPPGPRRYLLSLVLAPAA
ncbi:MAG: hypothetical protein HY855_00025 [Burkholderiales bacterium]|nr:hypothetical protein [Burkholderiales bacterium]